MPGEHSMIAYYVYERRTQKEGVWGAWTQIAFTPDLTYIDTVPAEGTQVQYRAKAVDDQGDEGPYVTGPAKAIDYNNPPVISGEDISLGVQTGGFEYRFSVDDPDGDPLWFYVTFDGAEVMRVPDAIPGQEYVTRVTDDRFLSTQDGFHQIVITAMDDKGATDTRTVTWERAVSGVDVICGPLNGELTEMPTQITLSPLYTLTADGSISVLACNNCFDASPTWEDMTAAVLNKRVYMFANASKTAESWGVKARIKLDKGYVPGVLALRDVGGSFK